MHISREHTLYKIVALTLALTLLLPTAVKFNHAFTHYRHFVCHDEQTTHLHKLDLDCKFYDFKLTQNYYVPLFNFEVFTPTHSYQKVTSPYVFLSNFKKLHFSLRGPPALI